MAEKGLFLKVTDTEVVFKIAELAFWACGVDTVSNVCSAMESVLRLRARGQGVQQREVSLVFPLRCCASSQDTLANSCKQNLLKNQVSAGLNAHIFHLCLALLSAHPSDNAPS